MDVLGCHCGRPPGPVMDMGGMPGPPGPRLLLGGGPRMPGPYELGPIGPMDGPRGGFIRGFIGLMPGGPTRCQIVSKALRHDPANNHKQYTATTTRTNNQNNQPLTNQIFQYIIKLFRFAFLVALTADILKHKTH